MFKNRVKKFIINISQNAKLNRENFISKKKLYNILLAENRIQNNIQNKKSYYNYDTKRNFTYYNKTNDYFKNSDRDPRGKIPFLILIGLCVYTIDGKFNVK